MKKITKNILYRIVLLGLMLVSFNVMLWLPSKQEETIGLILNRTFLPPFSVFLLVIVSIGIYKQEKSKPQKKNDK